jgi:hypothetical protein
MSDAPRLRGNIGRFQYLAHGQLFAMALLMATAASLLKAWNGVFMMAVRHSLRARLPFHAGHSFPAADVWSGLAWWAAP